MKKKITLSCADGIKVEVEADVSGGIAIHRPMYFEIDEQDKVVFAEGRPVYKFGDHYWRLTHANSGLVILHARTLTAAKLARLAFRGVDLDLAASLPEDERLKLLPPDHLVREMMKGHDVYLPPGWDWGVD